ncbi:ribosomal protein, putative [Entamoeba histolytica HM-1:IMSS-A]|uniref:Ribosomal protein, putative n=1 Tax=Entamoeba histolytica HM-1:IMSS-A TaxID=885318 RepID=N9TQJ6_ENTH1|nr:ribosomal protein, putative [Entamoeba histolytica HM-1:IMSS-A]
MHLNLILLHLPLRRRKIWNVLLNLTDKFLKLINGC